MTESEVVSQTEVEGEVNEEESNAEQITKLEADIIRQMEYYFGDINLPRDKFLQEQIKLDDGWVPYSTMLKFHRLNKLTTETKVITDALAKSDTGLIEVSEDGEKVRRNPEKPIPEQNEERRKELQARTVYVKGFPKDTSTVDSCLEFFKDYPKVENVIMRRYPDKVTKKWSFKGSVFATFEKREQAEKFLAVETIKIDESEIIKKWQEEYLKEKQAEYDSRKDKKNSKNKTEEKLEEPRKLPGGTVLYINDVTEKCTRENIKDAIVNLGGEVAYIDFNIGDKVGWVRLQGENTAKDVFEKCKEGKLSVDGEDISIKLVEGDEEKEYLAKSMSDMLNRRKRPHGKGKRGGRFGGNRNQSGGRNFDRKRKAEAHSDAPAKKV